MNCGEKNTSLFFRIMHLTLTFTGAQEPDAQNIAFSLLSRSIKNPAAVCACLCLCPHYKHIHAYYTPSVTSSTELSLAFSILSSICNACCLKGKHYYIYIGMYQNSFIFSSESFFLTNSTFPSPQNPTQKNKPALFLNKVFNFFSSRDFL